MSNISSYSTGFSRVKILFAELVKFIYVIAKLTQRQLLFFHK